MQTIKRTTTTKATYSRATTPFFQRLEVGGAAAADARVLLPWTGELRSSSERRAIVRAAHPEWSQEYQELVVELGA